MAFHVGKEMPHPVTDLAVDFVPDLAVLSPRVCVLTPTPLPPSQYKYASSTKHLDAQDRTGNFSTKHPSEGGTLTERCGGIGITYLSVITLGQARSAGSPVSVG